MKLAIIGAGWAGLSAAVRAADLQHTVTVFEASHTLGGRARAVHSRRLDTGIDNGQHILLGAYHETLALMQRLGVNLDTAVQRTPLKLESADGSLHLRIANAPAPLHLLFALLCARGFSIREKWQLMQALRKLQAASWRTPPGLTVQQWLNQHGQSPHMQQKFWLPLCVAALNTPVHIACAQIFAHVLRDSLGQDRSACDNILPRVDLSALWPNRTEGLQAGYGQITIRRGTTITRIARQDDSPSNNTPANNGVLINNEHFDAAILACNAPSVLRLLRQLPQHHQAAQSLMQALAAFQYVPIATVTLAFAQHWALPDSMYMLNENRAAGDYGQWLFNCPAFMNHYDEPSVAPALAHVVISDAQSALDLGEADLVRAICLQLARQTQRFGPMPDVINHDLIAEKRATFAAVPGLNRPGTATPWPDIWLAGDWTDTGYPAVLEGAVRSGRLAAEAAHRAWN